jgi:hypothetical protein
MLVAQKYELFSALLVRFELFPVKNTYNSFRFARPPRDEGIDPLN